MNYKMYDAMKTMIEMPNDVIMELALRKLTSDDQREMMNFVKNIQTHLEEMLECQ